MNALNKTLLYPLQFAYGVVTTLRNVLYDRGVLRVYRAALPIVSIGNLTSGGNGKTPMCIFLARELLLRGYKPVLLTRGYGGNVRGPLLIKEGYKPNQVGDEPLLLWRRSGCPVVVSRRRVEGCKYIEKHALGNIVILDDGFQHRALGRDVDLIVSHVSDPAAVEAFVGGALLPCGEFREDRQRAWRRAHMLVLIEGGESNKPLELDASLLSCISPHLHMYRGFVKPVELVSLAAGAPISPQPVVAFCAIAHPERFFETLIRMGYALAGVEMFPDHHVFSADDLNELRLKYPSYPLVCTEKDAVKFEGLHTDRICVLKIELTVRFKDAFVSQLLRFIKRKSKPAEAIANRL